MAGNNKYPGADRPEVIRLVIGETGICLDLVLVEGARVDPSIACVAVIGTDLRELRISLCAPQDPSGPAGAPALAAERSDAGASAALAVPATARPPLSPREIEVLSHLAGGRSNKAIAQAMHLSDETVRAHVKSILRKAGLENRTQAALWAVALPSLKPAFGHRGASQPDAQEPNRLPPHKGGSDSNGRKS